MNLIRLTFYALLIKKLLIYHNINMQRPHNTKFNFTTSFKLQRKFLNKFDDLGF